MWKAQTDVIADLQPHEGNVTTLVIYPVDGRPEGLKEMRATLAARLATLKGRQHLRPRLALVELRGR